MREFFLNLFSEHNSELSISLFSFWHIFYLVLTFGSCIALGLIFKKKSEKAKKTVVSVLACLTLGLYVADFFIMPLSDSYGFGISVYKLPFNICTLMASLVPFVQFGKSFSRFRPVVVMLSLTSSVMWMCYPGSALGGQPPFSYVIFQTFVFHSCLFNWAALSVALDQTAVTIKHCWHDLIGILGVFVLACLGNAIYPDQNWFFIQTSIFPFLSDEIMPVVVIAAVFAVCIMMYGSYYGIRTLYRKLCR